MRRAKKCRNQKCLLFPQQEVGYAGNKQAEIVFVGESPGKMEERTGRILQGDSGDMLRSIFRRSGIDFNSIYFLNGARVELIKILWLQKRLQQFLDVAERILSTF